MCRNNEPSTNVCVPRRCDLQFCRDREISPIFVSSASGLLPTVEVESTVVLTVVFVRQPVATAHLDFRYLPEWARHVCLHRLLIMVLVETARDTLAV